jgi:hypothetical protein
VSAAEAVEAGAGGAAAEPARHDPARELLRRALEHHGAVVDDSVAPGEGGDGAAAAAGGALEALLPEPLARRLEVPESVRFVFARPRGGDESARLAVLGSPVLERVVSLLRESGAVARLRLGDLHLKRERLADALHAAVALHDAKEVVQAGIESLASYVHLHLRYAATSDARTEGLFTVSVNEHSLAPLPALPIDGAPRSPRPFVEPHDRRPIESILQRAEAAARRELVERLAPFRAAAARRAARDHDRIAAYYADLLAEHDRRARRAAHADPAAPRTLFDPAALAVSGSSSSSSAPPVSADLVEKRRAIELDRDHKLAALRDRYTLQVQVTAVAACRVLIPVMTVPVDLHIGCTVTRRVFYWNPLLKAFEPATCDTCDVPTKSLFAQRDGTLLCRTCRPQPRSAP